ncbi:MAG: 3'-5' exonuclease [Bacteroidia bacterium]
MLNNIDLTKVLVLDVETVPQYDGFNEMPEQWQKLWIKKAQFLKKEPTENESDIYNRAGIYAEFGKIICISVGYFSSNGKGYSFKVKSFYGDDEIQILKEFSALVERHFSDAGYLLCAHNGKEFDFPYIARRCVINGLSIPDILNTSGKKPWEVNLLDTMELWKFGDYKSFTSLELLATALNIKTPKDDIDGSEVWRIYWHEKNIERIKNYCQKDVVTVARLLLKFKDNSELLDEDIKYA